MTIWQASTIFIAAFLAGMINSVAGGGTLLSFPALVWIGCDPINANATSAVALWPGSLAGMLGFRRELAGSRRWMFILGGPSLVGGLIGAFLLLRTPSPVFASIVPWLILFATVLFGVGEPITRRLRRASQADAARAPQEAIKVQEERDPDHQYLLGVLSFQFLVAIYGGYFGAGIGILMLAALGLIGFTDIHRMNGLKNLFAVLINAVAAVYFITQGAVVWKYAVVMATGAIVGGYGGAGLARRLGRTFVRRAVIVIGLIMAISLLFRG